MYLQIRDEEEKLFDFMPMVMESFLVHNMWHQSFLLESLIHEIASPIFKEYVGLATTKYHDEHKISSSNQSKIPC